MATYVKSFIATASEVYTRTGTSPGYYSVMQAAAGPNLTYIKGFFSVVNGDLMICIGPTNGNRDVNKTQRFLFTTGSTTLVSTLYDLSGGTHSIVPKFSVEPVGGSVITALDMSDYGLLIPPSYYMFVYTSTGNTYFRADFIKTVISQG